VVVVHGGPGFNHRYLTSALLPLAADFRLVFYDQRTRGGAVTPAGLTAQLGKILAAAGKAEGPPIVLGHSWGSYLAFACLASPNAPDVRGALLLSPMALTLQGFDRATARFKKSLPNPPPTSIKDLFPYYLAKRNRGKTGIQVPQFNATVYGKVTAALQRSSYDFRKAARFLPEATHLVFGRQDSLSTPSDFRGLPRRITISNIPGAAHFAFAEQPDVFRRLFLRAFA
jgi:pimeloyl-ACP methyl ester carboxylesterase